MAYQVPTALPPELALGTTWTWRRDYGDYPVAEGWSVRAEAVGRATRLTVPATGAGREWTFEAIASDTATLEAGPYRVTVIATLGPQVRVIEAGDTTVTANPIDAAPGSGLSRNERTLEALEAEIERRLVNGPAVESYSVGGRSVQLMPLRELERLRNKYAILVQRARGVRPAPILITYGPPR